MKSLLLAIAAFVAGLALGGTWPVRKSQLGQALAALALPGAKRLPHCLDIYSGTPWQTAAAAACRRRRRRLLRFGEDAPPGTLTGCRRPSIARLRC